MKKKCRNSQPASCRKEEKRTSEARTCRWGTHFLVIVQDFKKQKDKRLSNTDRETLNHPYLA